MKKRILFSVLIFMFWWIFFYFAVAFVTLEFNFIYWRENSRFIYIFLSSIFIVTAIIPWGDFLFDEKNKN